MILPDCIACPVCKSKLDSRAVASDHSKALTCESCSSVFPAADGIVDFRLLTESSANEGWSVEGFEALYEDCGDWDSIYEWDEKRGIPRAVSEYKYGKIKGWIMRMLDVRDGGTLLDLGCGNGYFLLELHRQLSQDLPNLTYIGIDASRHNVLNAMKKFQSRQTSNFYSVLGVGEGLPFDSNSIDAIVSSEVLEHIGDKETAISEIYRVLRPGGMFLFTTPSAGALRNWDVVLWPLRMIRRLSQGRLRGRGDHTAFDKPIGKDKYREMSRSAGFGTIEISSAQMLNDEVVVYLPKALLASHISLTRFFESNSRLMRDLFGLHITGMFRKAP